jgi:hypothetical protein
MDGLGVVEEIFLSHLAKKIKDHKGFRELLEILLTLRITL